MWLSYTPLSLHCWIHWYTPLGIRKWSWLWAECLGGNWSCLKKIIGSTRKKSKLHFMFMTFISHFNTFDTFLEFSFPIRICSICNCALHIYDSNYSSLVIHSLEIYLSASSVQFAEDTTLEKIHEYLTWGHGSFSFEKVCKDKMNKLTHMSFRR